jgi:hypothetical protein
MRSSLVTVLLIVSSVVLGTAMSFTGPVAAEAVAAKFTGSTGTPAVPANDSTNFGYGSDSNSPTPTGSAFPYQEPNVGGMYQGYQAEVGSWLDAYCGASGVAYNAVAGNAAASDYYNGWPQYGYGGVGYGFYYYMAGPGADPSYNGTTSEAYSWGESQAQQVIGAINGSGNTLGYPIQRTIWMDIESGSGNPYNGNGWNGVSNGCQSENRSVTISPCVDAATLNGFDYVISNATQYGSSEDFYGGFYSAPAFWSQTFSGSSCGSFPGVPEWTYENQSSITPGPQQWCEGSTCAAWFAGATSSTMDIWQWSNSAVNGSGDFDQIYVPNVSTFPGLNG